VADLEKDDFQDLDDKTPSSIRYFSKQTDLPLRIRPADGYFQQYPRPAEILSRTRLLRSCSPLSAQQGSSIRLTFRRRAHGCCKRLRMMPAAARRDRETRAGGGTAVSTQSIPPADKELSHPPRPPGDQPDVVRRVMIVISDGDDNLSSHTEPKPSNGPALERGHLHDQPSTQWIQLSQTTRQKPPTANTI